MKSKKRIETADEDDDDADDFEGITGAQIVIGDLSVTSRKSSLAKCSKTAISLLKNKTISKYLFHNQKSKMFKPDYVD